MNQVFNFFFCIIMISGQAKGQYLITGSVMNEKNEAIAFCTTVLKWAADSTMVKADITSEQGKYTFEMVKPGKYFIHTSYIGMKDFISNEIVLMDQNVEIPAFIMLEDAKVIEEIVVTGQRALIEVKPDRTVFNVQGTINSAGDNGLNLLRKAPGVLVDNNNNITVLGRSGVLIYVDGKRIPLAGDDLTNYLQSLVSEQIDKIDIITNPGAKYEAQGNAGIIDIRLKKDKNLGSNGSVSTTLSQGRYGQGNINANGNYRNKIFNTFGGAGYNLGNNWNTMEFVNNQNGLILDETIVTLRNYKNIDFRLGTDFFINKKNTIGFLVSGQQSKVESMDDNINFISNQQKPGIIDSILKAPNFSKLNRKQMTYNLNYAYESGKNRLNVDLDYGRYGNEADYDQPNYYYDPSQSTIISQRINFYSTPVEIDIATAKLDYETEVMGGNFGIGAKYSDVLSNNKFLFYNVINDEKIRNNNRSNIFDYSEKVSAAYVNYARPINAIWSVSGGLRVERTDAVGDLTAFLPTLEEEPVNFDYTSFFPSAGLTYAKNPEHVYSLNYGRRINRPDYNVLNPFREQLSELSYAKGNKFLQPEIVNNYELGYTLKYRYSIKLAYSLTSNQITRLIGPDEEDPRAGFISWDNLATQKLYSVNISAPIDIKSWWNAYMNFSASYTDNQADYGNGVIVDVQAATYSFYQQHTFTLPNKFKAELSGWYSGPGVWGGVFLYDPSYSINLGLQRRFINDQMNVRLSFSDITFQSFWSGYSSFNGLLGVGQGQYDSRRASVSVSYDLGNKNIKSRKRDTGIQSESKRVGG